MVGRPPLADLVVGVLDLAEEGIAPVGEHVLLRPDGQVTAGPQRPPGPRVPDGRVDPVPGRGREDQADGLVRRPALEPPLDHLDRESGQVPAGDGGELGAELDTGDAETAPGQREGRLARGAAHLEQSIAGHEVRQRDQVVEEGFGIVRPDPVVALGGLIERLSQPFALIVGPHHASMPPMIRDGRMAARRPARSRRSGSSPNCWPA
jgi:hypothetical protein